MTKSRHGKCSFCGKTEYDGVQVVTGPGVNICAQCVETCGSLLSQQQAKSKASLVANWKVPNPHEIKAYLDQYVIGQDSTKKSLSVAVHNHYKRICQKTPFEGHGEYADVEIEKSNILLIGPTGSGKTLLARTLARCLDVPFSISDATTLTEAGYVGEDVENILLRLIQAADYDISRAEMGIVYIDEIDKIARRTDNVSITRDVSGEGVQQALLKILEGTVSSVPPHGGRKHPEQEYLKINTEQILFICGGAFVGLDDIAKRRLGKHVIGFTSKGSGKTYADSASTAPAPIEPEDLLKFGLIPEFVGRLPVVSVLSGLDEEDLVRILEEPKNAMVRQYQKLLAMGGVKLTFTRTAVRALAKAALAKRTGARGLRAMLEQVMLDVMYEAPRKPELKSVCVDKEMIDQLQDSATRESHAATA